MPDVQMPFIPPEISEQQFLCELSMFPGTLALRLLPTEDYPGYHMEVMRGEERLGSLLGYIPDEVSDKVFRGISDMGCYDVNYDNNTDIIFIEVWGDTSIAVVYLGDMSESFSFATFSHDIALSPGNGLPAEFEMTAANVYLFLTKGKDNGSFESYQEAYLALVNILRLYMPDSVTYDLIQLDDDGIPELVLVNGFNIYIYTYKDGTLYQAMDGWGYGAGGNPGIEYCPGKNGIRAYYSEQAGAIHGAVYYEMNRDHEVLHAHACGRRKASCEQRQARAQGRPQDEAIRRLRLPSRRDGGEARRAQLSAYFAMAMTLTMIQRATMAKAT